MKNKLLILLFCFSVVSCSGFRLFDKQEVQQPIEIKLTAEDSLKERIINLIKNFEVSTTKAPTSFDKDSEDSRNAFNYQINKTIGVNKRVLASVRIINLKNSGVYYVVRFEIQTKNPDSVEKLEIKSASKDNVIEQIKNMFIE